MQLIMKSKNGDIIILLLCNFHIIIPYTHTCKVSFANLCSSCLLFTLSSPLERLLESVGLLKDWLEVLLNVGRCHGRMHVDLVEG